MQNFVYLELEVDTEGGVEGTELGMTWKGDTLAAGAIHQHQYYRRKCSLRRWDVVFTTAITAMKAELEELS